MNKVTQSIYKKKVDDLEQGGSGESLYRHTINETGKWVSLTIINKSITPFTKTSLAQWLYSNGYNSIYNRYTASNNTSNIGLITSGVFSQNGTDISFISSDGIQNYVGTNLVDIISEV